MIKFLPFENEGLFGMKAFENDSQLGYCTFTLGGYEMKFEEICCDDDIIIEGLARAAMNFAANKNAYIAKADKTLLCAPLKRLGFVGDEVMSVEIPEALTSGCSCPHSKPF